MLILLGPLEFQWDTGNSDKNYKKHGATHIEIEEAFLNGATILGEDTKHSSVEVRYLLWGSTSAKRYLTIIFTMRGTLVRVISARDMNKKERFFYEKEIKENTTF